MFTKIRKKQKIKSGSRSKHLDIMKHGRSIFFGSTCLTLPPDVYQNLSTFYEWHNCLYVQRSLLWNIVEKPHKIMNKERTPIYIVSTKNHTAPMFVSCLHFSTSGNELAETQKSIIEVWRKFLYWLRINELQIGTF